MPDPASTSAGSAALLKMFGIHISAGALAAALGFLVLWPRTMKEGFARLFCTIVASSVFGPILVVYLHSNRPELFESAQEMPDPASTSAGSAALLKMFGIHISAGALAAALGFLVLWPRTMKEGFARLFCTIVVSSVFGPILVVYLHSNRPELFESAQGNTAQLRLRDGVSSCHFPVEASPSFSSPAGQ